MTEDLAKRTNIRDEEWFKNVPEWLGEVLAQLTDNRQVNVEILARLEALKETMEHRGVILADKEQALISAVNDLRDFANTIYGPGSAIQQIYSKLEEIKQGQERDRAANDKRFGEVELAQEETDDRLKEFEERMDNFERRLAQLERS